MGFEIEPVKLAVIVETGTTSGGNFHQTLNACLHLKELPKTLCNPLFFAFDKDTAIELRKHGLDVEHIVFGSTKRLMLKIRMALTSGFIGSKFHKHQGTNAFEKLFEQKNIDLAYFCNQSNRPQYLKRINYIITLFDVCHRDQPEFPEIRGNFNFEVRESTLRAVLPKATAILVDSDHARTNVSDLYGLNKNRLYVFPFSPSVATQNEIERTEPHQIKIKENYEMDGDYVFYPAQFWPHKNHAYLLRGLKRLEEIHEIRIGAIFAGGRSGGHLEHIKDLARKLNLSDRIRFAGYVPDQQLPSLYSQSIALVMPTYFGSTNMPPLEAFMLGTPVIYSDLPGLRDQVGDAALLMDLANPDSLADHLYALIKEPGLKERQISRGKQRFKELSDFDHTGTLTSILQNFQSRRAAWGKGKYYY